MNNTITTAPTMPAITAASSESLPSVGDTVCTDCGLDVDRERAAVEHPGQRSRFGLGEAPGDLHAAGEDGSLHRGRRLDDVVEHDRQLAATGTSCVAVEALRGEQVPRRLTVAARSTVTPHAPT